MLRATQPHVQFSKAAVCCRMTHWPLLRQLPAVVQDWALTMCAAVPQRTSTHSSIVCACGARYLSSSATTANSHTHIAPEQILCGNPQAVRHVWASCSSLLPSEHALGRSVLQQSRTSNLLLLSPLKQKGGRQSA